MKLLQRANSQTNVSSGFEPLHSVSCALVWTFTSSSAMSEPRIADIRASAEELVRCCKARPFSAETGSKFTGFCPQYCDALRISCATAHSTALAPVLESLLRVSDE